MPHKRIFMLYSLYAYYHRHPGRDLPDHQNPGCGTGRYPPANGAGGVRDGETVQPSASEAV